MIQYEFKNHKRSDEKQTKTICNPSVERDQKKGENENSSIEVSRIHLEYRISQFLLYSHHIQ